jgi:CRISPR-associated Cas5-like protein
VINKLAVEIYGKRALWTNDSERQDPVSLPVPPCSGMVGILNTIFYKPQFDYVVEKVAILSPFNKHIPYVINEYKDMKRENIQQRKITCVYNPHYIVVASIKLKPENITKDDCTVEKYIGMFMKAISVGGDNRYHYPYLGRSDFKATIKSFSIGKINSITGKNKVFERQYYGTTEMKDGAYPIYFIPVMKNGWIDYLNAEKEISECL